MGRKGVFDPTGVSVVAVHPTTGGVDHPGGESLERLLEEMGESDEEIDAAREEDALVAVPLHDGAPDPGVDVIGSDVDDELEGEGGRVAVDPRVEFEKLAVPLKEEIVATLLRAQEVGIHIISEAEALARLHHA